MMFLCINLLIVPVLCTSLNRLYAYFAVFFNYCLCPSFRDWDGRRTIGLMSRVMVLFLGVFLFLAACGGSSRSSGKVTCDSTYWNGTFGTCLPKGWMVLSAEDIAQRGVPPEVVAVFQAQKPHSGQYPTIAVTTEELEKELGTPMYSEASTEVVKTLPGYERIDLKDEDVDGEVSKVHIFASQPIPEEPKRRFYQLSAVSEGVGYTFTATLPLSLEEQLEKEVLLILRKVSFEEEEEEEDGKEEEDEEG